MFTVDKTSWHYRMAERHKSITSMWDMPGDFCSYWRFVMFGVMQFTATTFIICAFVTFNLLGVVAAFAGVWQEFPWFAGVNLFTGLLSLAVGLGLTTAYISRKYYDYKRYKHNKQGHSDEPTASFIGTWYKTLKDKVCIRVEYK